jgi:dTDP-4-dehydrorhamnose 3,5-epimerase
MNINFRRTRIPEVVELVIEPHVDERGWIGEAFDSHRFMEHGLPGAWVSIKFFESGCGVLRGMHWQRSPREQAKLVACHHGEVFDVSVDMRPDSATFRQWVGVTLRPDLRNLVYVPQGFAHGVLSLAAGSRCSYAVAYAGHCPALEEGFRWDDPAVGIEWPAVPEIVVSDRDAGWGALATP